MKELGDKYESKLIGLKNFKIGKTGQTVKERYDSEYANVYESYMILGNSEDEDTIDEFEKYMIDRFIDFNNCDNEQIGGGKMAESNQYIVYLMHNS